MATPNPNPLSLDPAALQAIRDMIDALKADTKTRDDAAKQLSLIHGGGLSPKALADVEAAAARAAAGGRNAYEAVELANAAAERAAAAHRTGYTAAQDRLYRNVGTLSRFGFDGVGHTAVQVGQVGQGLHDLGFTGAGALVTRAAVPLAVAKGAIDAGARVATVMADPYMTAGQRSRALLRGLPGGEWATSTIDAYTGRAAGMLRAQEAGMIGSADAQANLMRYSFNLEHNPGREGSLAYANTYARQSAAAPPVMDRSTAVGEQAYRDASRLLPLKQRTLETERDLSRATAERVAAEGEAAVLGQRSLEAQKKARDLEKATRPSPITGAGTMRWLGMALTGGGAGLGAMVAAEGMTGPAHQQKLEDYKNATQEAQGLAHLQQQAAARVADARRREAEARGANDLAKLREQKVAVADMAQERATAAGGLAGRLGSMSPLERQQAEQLLKVANKYGADFLTPEMKAVISRLDPEHAEKLFQAAGAADPVYRRMQEQSGDRFGRPGQSPADLQREADLRRQDIGEGEHRIGQETARRAHDASKDMANVVAEVIEIMRRGFRDEINNQFRQGRNQ